VDPLAAIHREFDDKVLDAKEDVGTVSEMGVADPGHQLMASPARSSPAAVLPNSRFLTRAFRPPVVPIGYQHR
jgi:hypothetical protein